jgi:hypothetical protein
MKAAPLFGYFGLIIVAVAGCATQVKQTQPFNVSDFNSFISPGTAAITGQAFFKTPSGHVKLGDGETVELVPATPYTRERYDLALIDRWAGPRDPRLAQFIRATIADAQGNFSFRDVPSGNYILSCMISWKVQSAAGMMVTSKQVLATTTVHAGETVKVIVTR